MVEYDVCGRKTEAKAKNESCSLHRVCLQGTVVSLVVGSLCFGPQVDESLFKTACGTRGEH